MSFASTRCWKPLQIHGKWTLFPSLCPIFDVWCWQISHPFLEFCDWKECADKQKQIFKYSNLSGQGKRS